MKVIMQNNQARTKKIGFGYFYDTPKLKISSHLLFPGHVNRTLSCKQWKINNYYEQKWNLIFEMMSECEVQSIKLDNINKGRKETQNSFLKEITQVKYYNLQMITFYKCNICSIQSLSWLYAPCLRILQLTYNHIRTFKPLQKSSFMLQKLYIYSLQNVAVDFSNFSRIEQTLQILGLQFNELSQILSQDLSFLVKIMFNHQRSFEAKIGFVKRIQQYKLETSLGQKFTHHFKLHQNPNQIERYYTNDQRPIRKPDRFNNQRETRNQWQRRQRQNPRNQPFIKRHSI